MDITLGPRNQTTGRFNFVVGDDGDVSFDDTEAHAVMTSAIEHKEGYWADPTHGSEMYKLKNLTSKTPSQAEAVTFDSLQTLENDGSIVSPVVTARRSIQSNGLGRLQVDIAWTTPAGEPANGETDV